MKLHLVFAFGATGLLAQSTFAQSTFAQTAPPAPIAPATVPPTTQPGTWGLPPAGAPPAPVQPGAPVQQAAPYPGQPGAYPPSAYPPGAYPPGTYPPGAYPPPGGYPGGYPPPGWGGPAPEGGFDSRPTRLETELPYDGEQGIPPGYKLVEKKRTSLIIAGVSTVGGAWIISSIAGGIIEENGQYNNDRGWPMYIPVLGPFITIGTAHSSAAATTALLLDGVVQLSGLGMFIAGMVVPQKVLKFQFQAAAQLTLTPIAAPLHDGAFTGIKGTF